MGWKMEDRECQRSQQPATVQSLPKARWPFDLTAMDQTMKKAKLAALICAFTFLIAHDSSAAIRFKRFPHCPEGLVSKKTCECHADSSGRYHFCHAGYHCDTTNGQCN